jgi:Protein of unknown function (DUF4199)
LKKKRTMKKIVLTYGVIAGSIVAAMIFISIPLWQKDILNFDNGEVVGYTTMVVALSLIFVAIKSYRDKQNDGSITFWKGVKVGMLVTLIATIMYCLAWDISYRNMSGDFMQKMYDHYLNELKASGATAAEVAEEQKNWARNMTYYENFFIRFMVTTIEIVPVGLIITIISAALLRKKAFLPASDDLSNNTTTLATDNQ